jgi:hypothetical protein
MKEGWAGKRKGKKKEDGKKHKQNERIISWEDTKLRRMKKVRDKNTKEQGKEDGKKHKQDARVSSVRLLVAKRLF